MEAIKAALAEQYGFELIDYREAGGTTYLHTDIGQYYLQSVPAIYRYKSKFIERVKKHLQRTEGPSVLTASQTFKGQHYFIVDDELYYCYLGVREAALDNQPFAYGHALAQFHRATGNFSGDRLFAPYSSLGSWPKMWRKKLTHFALYRDELEQAKEEITPFDELLLTSFTYLYQLGDLSVQYLLDQHYAKVCKEAEAYGKIAYQNFDEGYILFDENGSFHLIGEWQWVIDTRTRDIGQWIKAETRRNGWRPETVAQFLDGYNSSSPLLDQEYPLLYAMLLYPGRYFKLVDMYRNLPHDEKTEVDAGHWKEIMNEELTELEELLCHFPHLVKSRYGVTIPTIDWLRRTSDR
ncbi:hypothetical protein [Brevibacillus fulvus]|uniref:CotS family spore coat protein n=1 Tax=Brevibacillus fulvus TaxID=1125967 RepID=A0A938Y2C2_9BACL|nr:hypothetical protein [Brevibacillus fulvus]MBM7592025.1 CotS family spore coat protein [Brevibacillus fulvus]